jgi:hypothetical protein
MKYPKRSQYKYAKSSYRIRNWPEYEAGLRRRGDLTIWLSDDAIIPRMVGRYRLLRSTHLYDVDLVAVF